MHEGGITEELESRSAAPLPVDTRLSLRVASPSETRPLVRQRMELPLDVYPVLESLVHAHDLYAVLRTSFLHLNSYAYDAATKQSRVTFMDSSS